MLFVDLSLPWWCYHYWFNTSYAINMLQKQTGLPPTLLQVLESLVVFHYLGWLYFNHRHHHNNHQDNVPFLVHAFLLLRSQVFSFHSQARSSPAQPFTTHRLNYHSCLLFLFIFKLLSSEHMHLLLTCWVFPFPLDAIFKAPTAPWSTYLLSLDFLAPFVLSIVNLPNHVAFAGQLLVVFLSNLLQLSIPIVHF